MKSCSIRCCICIYIPYSRITKEYSTSDLNIASRHRKYTVTPKAKEDKNNDTIVDALDDALLVSGDDFGFNETSGFFEDV